MDKDKARQLLVHDLAHRAVEMLGPQPFTIRKIISIENPDSIRDFTRLGQILLMAYDLGQGQATRMQLPSAFSEALQALHDQARHATELLADKESLRRGHQSAACVSLHDAQRRMARVHLQVGIINYLLMYSGDESITINNLTEDKLAQLLGLSQPHVGVVPGSTSDSAVPSAPELEHAS